MLVLQARWTQSLTLFASTLRKRVALRGRAIMISRTLLLQHGTRCYQSGLLYSAGHLGVFRVPKLSPESLLQVVFAAPAPCRRHNLRKYNEHLSRNTRTHTSMNACLRKKSLNSQVHIFINPSMHPDRPVTRMHTYSVHTNIRSYIRTYILHSPSTMSGEVPSTILLFGCFTPHTAGGDAKKCLHLGHTRAYRHFENFWFNSCTVRLFHSRHSALIADVRGGNRR